MGAEKSHHPICCLQAEAQERRRVVQRPESRKVGGVDSSLVGGPESREQEGRRKRRPSTGSGRAQFLPPSYTPFLHLGPRGWTGPTPAGSAGRFTQAAAPGGRLL